jgi:hypothetical protein
MTEGNLEGTVAFDEHPFEEPLPDERRTPLSRATRTLLLSIACVAPPLPLLAQTDEVAFANWRANPLAVGSRPAGMGGAFVAVADDARAAFHNPAGLMQIPLTEISASSGRPWFAVATGRSRLRVAAYFTDAEQEPLPQAGGEPATTLQPTVWEIGLAAGFQPFRRVRLGATVAYRRLTIDVDGDGPLDPEASALAGSDDARVRTTVGALVDLIPARVAGSSPFKLGVSFQPGVSWTIPRAGLGAVEIRRPSVSSVGLAWRASNAWSFSGQADVIRYHEVIDALVRNVGDDAAADFSLVNEVEPRFGTEFATPLRCGCGTIKLRAGLHYESPGTLVFQGGDPELRSAFRVRSWRTTLTAGASLFAEHFNNALRIDVDSRDVIHGPALSFGVVWRF